MNLLGAIDCFIKVVEAGSIVGAAKTLGVSAAAVSQTLGRLETHLDTRLLQRTTRSMALTESGSVYFEKVKRIALDLESAQSAISHAQTQLQGHLSIASTAGFGRHVLAPVIAGFAERYPQLTLELSTTDRKINHLHEGIDLSLRIEPQLEDGIIARKVATVPFVICASPDYLQKAGRPSTPADLQQHACLAFRYPLDGRLLRWWFVEQGQRFEAAINATAISDDIDALAQMAAHGAGITRLAEFVAAPYLESGQLVSLFEPGDGSTFASAAPLEIYACVQERAAMTSKVKAFTEFLQEFLHTRWPAR
ncbi:MULTISPECIES: LysR family transcriptional regulator [Pseudomonas]|jgi:DNA-binding transcriptional LysR family regulator|uniref:LysR family transcriptional regulator n=1 Tax=Pseudomonas fluorescens TaxID=294 RepID=A0AAE2DKL4_PSEFL|nr:MULTISPECIES: LysR family transcriptional regulator [Pseudomonas]KIF61620.1 LysR family transcriptional regulator [Pseudomonas fluorescens]MBP3999963.1 LysR family transcriptional regulator [Pseudomonas koreensis]QIA03913.1 LysR family transcriptional regulator [Pseudomonas fluorescens]TFA85059.1 DNA-binding transcriptional LysR family regulator [Pseudomonas sp. LAIL14HWK12:I2]